MIRTLTMVGGLLMMATMAIAQEGLPNLDEDFQPDRPAAVIPASDSPAGSVRCAVKYISQPIISAAEAGVLLVAPTEGQRVSENELLAQTDDNDAKWAAKAAEYAVAALQKELDSEIRLEYSKASEQVRKVAYEKARQANEITPGAIPDIEIREQAFRYKEAQLSFENTLHERAITEINLSEKHAEWQRALAMMERHKVLAPINGFVAEVEKRVGEYVRPGDPIARLVQLDRVRIAANLSPNDYPMDQMVGRHVTITVDLGSGRTANFDSVISFANPRLDADGKFEVWAEVDVPDENLRDGMQGTMQLKS